MMDNKEIKTLEGKCPTCDGEATVFPSSSDNDKGHVYCDEDDCGWIHRHLPNVSKYVTERNN